MKKILSIALVVMMLIACVPFTANAAGEYGYGWQWDDSVAYGDIQNIKYSPDDVVIEFDASIVRGAEGALFEIWTKSGGNLSVNPAAGTASIGTQAVSNIAWGELSGTNWHHIKYTINAGAATIAIDGTVVVSGTGVTAWGDNRILLFSNNGILTITNLVVSNNAGTELLNLDFTDEAEVLSHFTGDCLGSRVALVSSPPDPNDPVDPEEPVDPPVDPEEPVDPDVPVEPTEVNWVIRVDGYADLAKEIDKCEGGAVLNEGSVEFDLWMLPGSSGTSSFQIFESWEGSVRPQINANSIGWFYTFTEAEELHGFSWGDLSLDNKRTFRMDYTDSEIQLYVDGEFKTSIPYGTTPAMPGIVLYVTEGFILMDNLTFSDSEGNILGSYDIDNAQPRDNDGSYSFVALGDCATYGHLSSVIDILKLSPKCTEEGYSVRYCVACGQEASRTYIPALGHAYGSYAAGKVTTAPTAEEDGVISWTCGRCGLDAAKGVAVATGDYTGSIVSYDDFSDTEVTKYITGGFPIDAGEGYLGEVQEIEDGNAIMHSSTDANYHQFLNEIDTTGFTVSFDFRYNELLETSDSENYGHNFHFWFGGSSIINNCAGYDFINGEFYIKPSTGAAYDPITAAYELAAGEWNNITFKYYSNTDTFEAWCAFYVNGEQVCIFDGVDAAYELPYDANRATAPLLLRTFGIDAAFDNFVIGDVDFEWINFRTPTSEAPIDPPVDPDEPIDPPVVDVEGDIDGDGVANSRDALMLKLFLIGANELDADKADINGDGVVNGKDSRALKAIILGVN